MLDLKSLLFGAIAGLTFVSVLNVDANAAGAKSSIQGQGEFVLAQADGAKKLAPGAGSSGRAIKGLNNPGTASKPVAPAARAVRSGENRSRAKASGGAASVGPLIQSNKVRETSRTKARQDDVGQPNRRRDGVARGGGLNRGVHRGTRYSWGPGALFWFYDGYYHGDCAWLRRKAETTGSKTWWRRFRQCRAGY